jgi:hypothetical protein
VPDTVVVGVPGAIDLSHAPVPATGAEALVFGTLYEPLVRLDCDGHVVPALATQWTHDAAGHWRFTLRANARFWDGNPVTSPDVAALLAGRIAAAESLATPDARTLVVTSQDTTLLRQVADPRLAIARVGDSASVPLGTTPYRAVTWTSDRVDARMADRSAGLVRFWLSPGGDPRDLLDEGADLVMTGDPAALRYALGRDQFDVIRLPWARTYVLVSPWSTPPASATDLPGLVDAVRGEVRLAETSPAWAETPPCRGAVTGPDHRSPPEARTIAYLASDHLARDIADRLAALAVPGAAPPVSGPARTLALSARELAAALASSGAWEFVIGVPRRSYRGCRDVPPGPMLPLLDATSSLIARRGLVSVVVGWDGSPRVVAP